MRQTENSQKWAVATQLGKFRRYTFVESFHIILEKYKLSWYVLKIQLTFQSFPFSLVLYFRCLSHLFILVLFHDFGINIVFQLIFTIVETPVGIQFLKVTYILQIKYPFLILMNLGSKPLTSLINLFQVLSKKDQNMDHLTNTFTSIATWPLVNSGSLLW